MSIWLQIFAFIFAIFLLVTIHEFGHFWVARRFGIKVLRFSIGFGKILWRTYDKKGTEFAISLLPLGGYVKLLDSREGPVRPEEAHQEFNGKPAWIRFLVLIAGPLTNWLLAIGILWIIFSIGITQIQPIVGQVIPNSIAAQAGLASGDKLLSIDGRPTPSWQKVFIALAYRLGEKGQMSIQVLSPDKQNKLHQLNLSSWQVNGLNPDPLLSLGIKPYHPPIPPVLAHVLPNKPADKAGLKPGDQFLTIGNQPIQTWDDLIVYVQQHPDQTVPVTLRRGMKEFTVNLNIGSRYLNSFKPTGFIGAAPEFTDFPKDMQVRLQYSPWLAGLPALKETISFSIFNFVLLGKMIVGHVSLQGLGGPITIFNTAKMAFSEGVIVYLNFIAIFSTMLAVLNILPIPGLDGGHILILLLETIRGRAFSLIAQLWFYRAGMILIAFIMMQALINDIMRLF